MAPPKLQRWALFFDLIRPHKKALAMGFFLLIATNVLTMIVPKMIGEAIDWLDKGEFGVVLAWAAAVLALTVLRFFVRIFSRFLSLETARHVSYGLRERLFAKFLRLPPSYYQEKGTGDLISRAINDVNLVQAMAGFGIMFGLSGALSIVLAVIFILTINAELALWLLIPIPPIAAAVAVLGAKIRHYTLEGQKSLGRMTELIQENISGVSLVKGFALEESEARRFDAQARDVMNQNIGEFRARSLMLPVMILCTGVSELLVLYVGGQAVIAGELSLGDFASFNLYLAFLVFPTIAVGWTLSLQQRAEAALIRLKEILDADESIADPKVAAPAPERGHISISKLSFRYPERQKGEARRLALDKVSLEAAPGEIIGIVGRVGSGKSTLIRALLRLIELPRGAVSIDGRDIADYRLSDLRRAIALVPQDEFLFSAPVERNIALGWLKAPAEAIARAAGLAHVSGDIEGFPQGYKTRLGERGLTVSGGQRQRIGIARALLRALPLAERPRPAKILVLDDCLSAVDAETAAEILHSLKSEVGCTAIISAHRLQSIRHADRIYVLERGRIVQCGSHEALLAEGGMYKDMWEQQLLALEIGESLEPRHTLEAAP